MAPMPKAAIESVAGTFRRFVIFVRQYDAQTPNNVDLKL
jgi:hypothetical protein